MKVCLTYANRPLQRMQLINGHKIKISGFFDRVILTSPHDLSKKFVREYKHILKYRRGAGYWVWKPYIIKQTLMSLSSEDILCYVDADFHFYKPIDPAIEVMVKWQQDIMPFSHDDPLHKESTWTKKDAFMLMNCDKSEWMNSPQRVGGFSLWRGGSKFALAFLDEWLHYAKDVRIITDLPSQCPNDANFRRHRRDQSIFSLLTKKYNLRVLPFPIKMAQDSEDYILIENKISDNHQSEKSLSKNIKHLLTLIPPLRLLFSLYGYLFHPHSNESGVSLSKRIRDKIASIPPFHFLCAFYNYLFDRISRYSNSSKSNKD